MAKEATTKSKATRSNKNSEAATVQNVVAESTQEPIPITPKKINPDQIVTVFNGYQGRLVYRSKRTGELWVWEEFGDPQDMELSELKNARNSSKKFFTNNWFMFEDDWVVDYLGLQQYYKHALTIDNFDEIFEKPADEIKEVLSALSEGQRRSVAYRARQLIADGGIDSRRIITTLEECLNVELIER